MTRTTLGWMLVMLIGSMLTIGGCAGSMSNDGMMKKDDSTMMKKDGMADDKMMEKK